eukprot:933476_1
MYEPLLDIAQHVDPDVMVIDMWTLAGLDVAQKLGIPYVLNSPTIMFSLDTEISYLPAWSSGFSLSMSRYDRCISAMVPRAVSLFLAPMFFDRNQQRIDRGLPKFKSQRDFFTGSIFIINTAFGLERAHHRKPTEMYVGPLLPGEKEWGALSEPVHKWLEQGDTNSTVVVLTGSGAMSFINEKQVDILMKGLTITGMRVLWALPFEHKHAVIQSLPPQFIVKSNVPPLPVISHPSVGVVVSPCGMALAQEALSFGKPLLCIPLIADQSDVAARVADNGAGIVVEKEEFKASRIARKIKSLVADDRFALAAARLGALLRAAGGTKKAARIVERAARGGFGHLRNAAEQLPWHQSLDLDIFAVFIAVSCIVIVLLRSCWTVLSFCIRKCMSVYQRRCMRASEA